MSTRIKFSNNGTTPFARLIGHNPDILEKWNELDSVLFSKTHLDDDLLEQVRRTLAFGNACEYCMVKGGKPHFDQNNKRILYATAFAQMFVLDHTSIVEGHFDMLHEVFTDQEISELCVFISFITASQKFGSIMNLTEDLQTIKVTTLQELEQMENTF